MSYVVVPAHDERELIGACLEALAAQTAGRDAFTVVLVLDACTDGTGDVAREAASTFDLALVVLECAARSAGVARRLGMDHACRALHDAGQPDGLIACTDADTRPEPDWLSQQLALVDDGACAIAGLIELDETLAADVGARRKRRAAARLHRVRAIDPTAAHHHFAGASIGITAATYRAVGGLEPLRALEDEAFAQRLADNAIAVVRSPDVRVRTSARRDGRAVRGLAVDLDVAQWLERRCYQRGAWTVAELARAKGKTRISVVIPAKDVAATVGGVIERAVGPARDAGLIDEVMIVDAGSPDGTAEVAAEAGAVVIQQDDVRPEYGRAQGKGDAMWRAVSATDGDIVCFLDADTADPHPDHLLGLIGPLLTDPELMLVKGAFERPLCTAGGELAHEGGRVTELMARPLINLHFPRLAGFGQPLAGEVAARRDLLEAIAIPVGYGVEIAMLIDALNRHGLQAIAQADLGTRRNRHQPLRALGEMAYAVLAAVQRRIEGDDAIAGGHYLRPWADGDIAMVPVAERPPLRTLGESVRAPTRRGWSPPVRVTPPYASRRAARQ
jgi:glucosyl-3-phosphoglycerate synthase